MGLVGLAVAFGAAVFSTVAAESGQAMAAVVLASAALLLAATVGLIAVPPLLKRVAARRVGEALNYDMTKEGTIYLLLTVAIGIAALNTGNNLLFIIVSAMLAAVLVSGIASALVVLGLELDVLLPEQLFAGSAAIGRIVLQNRNRLVPAISVSVVPPHKRKRRARLGFQKSSFRFPPKARPGKEWFLWPDLSVRWVQPVQPQADIFTGAIYFPFIGARRSASAELQLNFPRRGLYSQEAFGLSTRFPFSFLRKTRTVSLHREIVVYPSVEPTDEFFEMLPLITGEFESYVRGRGFELYRIRDYTQEDPARYVDWKATARTGDLKVREFSREDERKLRLIFDNPAPGDVADAAYENGVALAASLAWHFSEEAAELTFLAPEYPASSDLYGFLRYLALVKPAPGRPLLEQLPLSDDYNIVVTARTRGSIPTPLWNNAYFVFMR